MRWDGASRSTVIFFNYTIQVVEKLAVEEATAPWLIVDENNPGQPGGEHGPKRKIDLVQGLIGTMLLLIVSGHLSLVTTKVNRPRRPIDQALVYMWMDWRLGEAKGGGISGGLPCRTDEAACRLGISA